ncbi:hypothetical protein PV516_18970 [Streptomyces scabiei]|uniref:hypothetical protein n=1 Tax=Streptomyces scabiei TaxID=1930 RepID=UPI0029A4D399|nr:hypothetical protein [Streptomyces scabiei]MDX3165870.1 hypothetical protein [Streptomyces scabiei]
MTVKSRVRSSLLGRRYAGVETGGAGVVQGIAVRAVGRPPAEPERPTDLLLRFRNAVGAYIDVLGPSAYSETTHWHCRGCREDTLLSKKALPDTRTDANVHAGQCRAIDLTKPAGS